MGTMPSARSRTHYEVLGVSPDCSFEELRTAYRRLARALHPDMIGTAALRDRDVRLMAEVNEAWRVLSDTSLRRHYDTTVVVPVARSMTRSGSSTAMSA